MAHILELIYQNPPDLLEQLQAHDIEVVTELNHITEYGESFLRVAANNGRWDVIAYLRDLGGDLDQLRWSNLHHAVIFGTITDVQTCLSKDTDIEAIDFWQRTPLLLAIQLGDLKKCEILLEFGADPMAKGRCGKPPLAYAAQMGHVDVIRYLVDLGFDLEMTDDFADTALFSAVEQGQIAATEALIALGANKDHRDHIGEKVIAKAQHPEMVNLLIQHGAQTSEISMEMRRMMRGAPEDGKMPEATQQEYEQHKKQIFGKRNGEKQDFPFYKAMVRAGCNAYIAREKYKDPVDFEKAPVPVWCFDRFGQSLTFLPDGRMVEIAGEHEDSYDPDFCIYNDVVIYEANGDFQIYAYPEKIFPCTDFHSATYVDGAIYIIGNLGYAESRNANDTPVYKLDMQDLEISEVKCKGEHPGWIYGHEAVLTAEGEIQISKGTLYMGDEKYQENEDVYILDLKKKIWRKEVS